MPPIRISFFGEVDRDDRLAAAAVALRIGAEARQVDDRVFGREPRQLVGFRPHQQGADEQVVPGEFVDHADLDAMLRLRPAEEIRDVELLLVGQRQQEIVLQRSNASGSSACCRCSTR